MTGVVAERPYATLPAVIDEPPTASFGADDLVAWTGGRLVRRSTRRVRGAAVDSRLVRPDNLFVALPGERTDGHRFLGDAVRAGAVAILVSSEPSPSDLAALGDVTVALVDDGVAALGAVAARWRDRFHPLVVGVTGSIAKTSAKEAIATVLATRFTTLRSPGNRNNEIGLPLALLDIGPEHEAAILEMGMYVGGEIADLAAMARPRIGVVTAVQGVHLSRIGTIDAVERAKGELVEALQADGTAVLNADDPRVARMRERTAARVLTYGFDPAADVRADEVRSDGTAGMRFRLVLGGAAGAAGPTDVTTPALGRLSVHNALAAAAVGLAAGLSVDEIVAGIARGWAAPHRATLVDAPGATIVDDSYNASPASMAAALELLAGLPGRRVAILGEMLELGDGATLGHEAVGRAAADTGVDLLITVGPAAASIATAAADAGLPEHRIVRATDRPTALAAYLAHRAAGDVVLVKASRGAELDRLVDDLVAALGEMVAQR